VKITNTVANTPKAEIIAISLRVLKARKGKSIEIDEIIILNS
jgi:hypothetical protein